MSKKEKTPKVKQAKVKQPKVKKPIYKKWWFYVLIVLILLIIAGGIGSSSDKKEKQETATSSVAQSTKTVEASGVSEVEETTGELEVAINVSVKKEGTGLVFDIDTNLPDETELMLSLSTGDYNADSGFMAQGKVSIVDGKATSEPFLDNGEATTGEYDLTVSMSLPSIQSDAVRKVIGEKGENMAGPLVKPAGIGDAQVVEAMFSVNADEATAEATDDYTHTVFREETEESVEEAAATADESLSFVLNDGELGDYGEEVTLNAGTEFEEVEIMYHIPAGLYSVKNLNPDGGEQVTVYSGAPVLNGEWEEFVADDTCPSPIVVMGGEAKDLEIKEGQFVVLADGGSNLEFTMK